MHTVQRKQISFCSLIKQNKKIKGENSQLGYNSRLSFRNNEVSQPEISISPARAKNESIDPESIAFKYGRSCAI